MFNIVIASQCAATSIACSWVAHLAVVLETVAVDTTAHQETEERKIR